MSWGVPRWAVAALGPTRVVSCRERSQKASTAALSALFAVVSAVVSIDHTADQRKTVSLKVRYHTVPVVRYGTGRPENKRWGQTGGIALRSIFPNLARVSTFGRYFCESPSSVEHRPVGILGNGHGFNHG